jgi:hypothetical protein
MKQTISIEDINRIKEIYRDGQENGIKETDNPFIFRSDSKGYNTELVKSETFFCDLRNDELVGIVKKYVQINEDTEYLSSIHYIHYREGEEAKEHTDTISSIRTYIIMLNDDFEGGEFYLDTTHIPFGLGEMIKFDGTTPHSVKAVKSGNREVLAVWINRIPKHNKSMI